MDWAPRGQRDELLDQAGDRLAVAASARLDGGSETSASERDDQNPTTPRWRP